MAKCKRCDSPIVWIRTAAGNQMPCDPEVTTAPTVLTTDGHIVKDGHSLGQVPHWATCPHASTFRGKKLADGGSSQGSLL